jgi:hypothetical protein
VKTYFLPSDFTLYGLFAFFEHSRFSLSPGSFSEVELIVLVKAAEAWVSYLTKVVKVMLGFLIPASLVLIFCEFEDVLCVLQGNWAESLPVRVSGPLHLTSKDGTREPGFSYDPSMIRLYFPFTVLLQRLVGNYTYYTCKKVEAML